MTRSEFAARLEPSNPFVRYRDRLDSYHAVRSGQLTDEQFVEIVETLDAEVAHVGGIGFVETPAHRLDGLAEAAKLDLELWVKVEAHNVGGSHKARHLFGVALQMHIDEQLGAPPARRLAIASCGNAALGAGIVAAALKKQLDVYVPTWADETVVADLEQVGAKVNRCPRRPDEAGDPAYLRFREAVANSSGDLGAVPFSVQGTDTPTTFDGGRTLGWEFADQVPNLDSLYIQVGGGALATATAMAMPSARIFPVQTEGCAPLRRAWDLLNPGFDFEAASASPDRYMQPWESEPQSLATGILDDVTYDWQPLLAHTHRSGGEPIVASESNVERAYHLAHAHTDIPVCATGTAGFAGLLEHRPKPAKVGLIFSGIDRLPAQI